MLKAKFDFSILFRYFLLFLFICPTYRAKDLLGITDVVGLDRSGAGVLDDGVLLAGLLLVVLVLVPLVVLGGEVCPAAAPAGSAPVLQLVVGPLVRQRPGVVQF